MIPKTPIELLFPSVVEAGAGQTGSTNTERSVTPDRVERKKDRKEGEQGRNGRS
jgi:hypothetical protein